jgi:hypothetical protein
MNGPAQGWGRWIGGGLLIGVAAGPLIGAVELWGDVGLSRARLADGEQRRVSSLQPGVILHPDTALFPTVGVVAGPAVVVDRATRNLAAGLETRLVAGLGGSTGALRGDLLGALGGGYWQDRGAGFADGWVRSHGVEGLVTWAFASRLWAGPGVGWLHRQRGEQELDERRVHLSLIYRFE